MPSFTFLGTSAGVPTKERNVSALALRPDNNVKKWWLFDCGEGTQHRLMQTSLSSYHLSTIFITHLHGDHIYGLFGLLASRGMSGAKSPLTIFGPSGLQAMLSCVMDLSQLHLPFELSVHEVDQNSALKLDGIEITVVGLSHSIPSYGYVIKFPDRSGHFDVEKAKTLGIPEGPLYGRLKAGESVHLEDGRTVDGRQLVSVPTSGPVVAIGGDNDTPLLFAPYAPFDLMIHEATYTQKDFDKLPKKFQHSTAKQVAEAAEKMGVAWLILNHISPRYDNEERILELKVEVCRYFSGKIDIAYDLMHVTL